MKAKYLFKIAFIVITVLTLLIPSVEAIAQEGGFVENFEDSDLNGWVLSEGVVISDGVLRLETGDFASRHGQWEEFELAVRAKVEGQGALVINFCVSEGGAYHLLIESQRLVLQKESATGVEDLAEKGGDMPWGDWVELSATVEAGEVRLGFAEEAILEFSDANPLSGGGIGFEVLGQASTQIDEVSLQPIGVSPPPTNPSDTPTREFGTWIRTGGPPGGLGYDIRMDPRDPDVMYVTDAWAGAFKSTDGGETWFPINNGITARVGPSGDGIPVFSLTIDPNNPDTLWAGTQFSGAVFRSDDAGQSWRSFSNGIQEASLTIRGLTVEPDNSEVVYLAGEISSWEWNNGVALPGLGLDMTKGVVYKTTDKGQHWTRIWYGDNLARYIWINPENHDLLYVSTGIFDREAANSNPNTADPGGVGILRSYDGGESWEILGPENGFREEELYFGSLYMSSQNPSVLIAAAGNDPYQTALGHEIGGIYLTENGGDTWERVLELSNASTVEISDSDPDIMYAGSINGIYRSTDGGHTWIETVGNLWGSDDVLAGFPIDMQCDPRDPMRIFVNNYIGGNFLSEDGGLTWRISSKGYTGALLRQVDVAAGNPAYVYSASRMGIFVSWDGGDTWKGTAYGPARTPEAIVVSVDRFDPNHILAVLQDAGPDPKVTWDGGSSWSIVNTGLWAPGEWGSGTITKIVFSPYEQNIVLASAGAIDCYTQPGKCESEPGYGVIRSTDGGQTWSQTGLNGGQVTDLVITGVNSAYAAVYPDTVYRSLDGGETWELLAQGIAGQITFGPSEDVDIVIRPVLIAIAVDPFDSNRLFAGFENGGLMTSTDGGQTWNISPFGLAPEISVTAIEVDEVRSGTVYLGSSNSGVYYSIDYGASWISLNDGLGTRAVVDLGLSDDGQHLYAATQGEGVFRFDFNGQPPATETPETPSDPDNEPSETNPGSQTQNQPSDSAAGASNSLGISLILMVSGLIALLSMVVWLVVRRVHRE